MKVSRGESGECVALFIPGVHFLYAVPENSPNNNELLGRNDIGQYPMRGSRGHAPATTSQSASSSRVSSAHASSSCVVSHSVSASSELSACRRSFTRACASASASSDSRNSSNFPLPQQPLHLYGLKRKCLMPRNSTHMTAVKNSAALHKLYKERETITKLLRINLQGFLHNMAQLRATKLLGAMYS